MTTATTKAMLTRMETMEMITMARQGHDNKTTTTRP